MCLLVIAFQMITDAPLIVAANRDERPGRHVSHLPVVGSTQDPGGTRRAGGGYLVGRQ